MREKGLRGWPEAWQWLLKSVILPAGDHAIGQGMIKRLKFLEGAQWWPTERLTEYQDQCLRELVKIAYDEVPYYRELMNCAGVRPADIGCAADLQRLPISTKRMLSEGYPEATTRKTRGRSWEACTSGSTGENFRVVQDASTAGRIRAVAVLSFRWAGWDFGCPHIQTGMTLDRGIIKRTKDLLLGCAYTSAFDLSDDNLDKILELINSGGKQFLMGYAGSLFVIAERATQVGFNTPLSAAISWGDNLFPHYRSTVETAFKCRVFDTYGCAEGIQIAAQCGEGQNFHAFTSDTVSEIVDDAGIPVKPGEIGNVVLTRLHPGPMPLIRYRVGDLAEKADDSPCPCGRGFSMFGKIHGRDTDIVVTPSGNRLIVHFFTGILEQFREIDSFQIIQTEVASIHLRLVPSRCFDNQVPARVRHAIQEKGARDLAINIDIVNEIPLPPSGKRRFVISRIPAGGIENRESRASGDAPRQGDEQG